MAGRSPAPLPPRHAPATRDLEEADEVLTIKGRPVGYASVTRRRHDGTPTGKLAHRWWYRCLARAGLVPEGAESGMHMYRGRHTSATELQGSRHDLRLTQLLLGHADIRSTARYAQFDTADLAQALSEQRAQEGDKNQMPHPENAICGESGGGGNRTRARPPRLAIA
jgi:integrase